MNKLLTRKQVIELWSKQSEEALNNYVCPNCRDILLKIDDNTYYCSSCDEVLKNEN